MGTDVKVWCILLWLTPSDNFKTQETSRLPGNKMFGRPTFSTTTNQIEATSNDPLMEHITSDTLNVFYGDDHPPPDHHYPVIHAGLPMGLAADPLPLGESDHELSLNVSWIPSLGPPATDYSLEVQSTTNTVDCQTPICYEYNIPGDRTWWLIPAYSSHVAETCAVHPGCAYTVKLIAHPWDGHTSANIVKELDECVQNVCSCAHSLRLPAPVVVAQIVVLHGETFANVSWSLPQPQYPQRLPQGLMKRSYLVSLGKQMVSDAHPAPWFANTISQHVEASGLVSENETLRSLLLPVERNHELSGERNEQRTGQRDLNRSKEQKNKASKKIADVKILARVNLIDDRSCIGPEGNAPALNPVTASSSFAFGTYAIVLIVAGAWIIGVVFVLSARVVKRVLKSLHSSPVSAPLAGLSCRQAWFPMQLRT